MSHPTVADSNFGNKEDITVTLNTPVKPPNPTAPDFTSQGKAFDAEDVANGATAISKSVKIVSSPGHFPIKTVWVASDQVGEFDVEVMMDESEIIGGNAVWRKITATPIPVAVGVLSKFSITDLFRQIRIKHKNTSATPGKVNAWIMSIA